MWFNSHLTIVAELTLKRLANSFCKRPRSSLRVRIRSPIVFNSAGYSQLFGFSTLTEKLQKGYAITGNHSRHAQKKRSRPNTQAQENKKLGAQQKFIRKEQEIKDRKSINP